MPKNGDYNLAKAPADYPGRTYHHEYIPEHHLVWWQETGEVVGDDEVIHHQNGDKTDNRFENLAKMDRADHSREHQPTNVVVLRCVVCGSIFETARWRTHLNPDNEKDTTTCSPSCAGKWQHRDEPAPNNVLLEFDGELQA